jgi:hypothetical protein
LTPLPGFFPRRRITLGDLCCLRFGFGGVSAKERRRLEIIFHEIKPRLNIVGVQLYGFFQVSFYFAGQKKPLTSRMLRLLSIGASKPTMIF